MIRKLYFLGFWVTALMLVHCKDKTDTPVTPNNLWTVNKDFVQQVTGYDGIVAIENPQFSPVEEINFLRDEDLVAGVLQQGEVKAYPYDIIEHHEIVNDEIDGKAITVSYCPLTATSVCWDASEQPTNSTFGVSGFLYHSNLVLYDRNTESLWSQIDSRSIFGKKKHFPAPTIPIIETSWGTWKKMFPNSKVLNQNTGSNFRYASRPYDGYEVDGGVFYPIGPYAEDLFSKERVLGVRITGSTKVYRFKQFPGKDISLIQDKMDTWNFIVLGSTDQHLMVAYRSRVPDGPSLEFTAVNDPAKPQVVMLDQEGGEWNIEGRALNGPYAGTTLEQPHSFIGFYFAWSAFNPDLELYE